MYYIHAYQEATIEEDSPLGLICTAMRWCLVRVFL
jgi:hypothetical protein